MFTEIDHQKFRNLRITHVATRFEELISDEANDELTPEQIFLTAVDDALDQRQAHRIDKLIRAAKFPMGEYLEAWGPPDIASGGQRYCRWGPVIASVGTTGPVSGITY